MHSDCNSTPVKSAVNLEPAKIKIFAHCSKKFPAQQAVIMTGRLKGNIKGYDTPNMFAVFGGLT